MLRLSSVYPSLKPSALLPGALLAGVLLTGGAALRAQGAPAPTPTVVAGINEAASGTQYACTTGQLVEIVLGENASTGFTWTKVSTAAGVLSLLDETTDYPGTAIGRPGFRHYLFRATAEGTGTVQLIYSRPWESVPPAKTFTLQVLVAAPSSSPEPAISTLSAAALRPGDRLVVKGRSFVPGGSIALLDSQPVQSWFLSADTAILQVPAGVPDGVHTASVQTGDHVSNAVPVTVSQTGPAYDPLASAIRGDMDGDSQLTLKDAVLLLRQIVGLM